ncbi:MAG TPA: ferredoxin [Gaiellales bacterium]|jgi:ferredoxin
MNTPVHLIIDRDTCIGYGECVSVDSDAVALDQGGCAYALVDRLAGDRAKAICDACPTGAIRMTAATGSAA